MTACEWCNEPVPDDAAQDHKCDPKLVLRNLLIVNGVSEDRIDSESFERTDP